MSEYHYQQRERREKERRRKQAEQRRLEQEVKRLRKSCTRKHAAVQDFLLSRKKSDLSDFLASDTIASLQTALDNIGKIIQHSDSHNSLKKSKQGLRNLHKQIKAEIKAAEKLRKNELQRIAELEKELSVAIEKQLLTIRALQHGELSGLVIAETSLLQEEHGRLQTMLHNKQFDEVLSNLSQLSAKILEVEELAPLRYKLKQNTAELLAEIKEQASDRVNKIWVGRELTDLGHKTNALLKQYSQGVFQKTAAADEGNALAVLEEHRDNLLLEAGERQQDEEERKRAVGVFIAALKAEGFSVANPRIEGGQRGTVLITATRPGRSRKQKVALKINLDGNVEMDVDGGDPGDVRKIQEARLDKKKESQVACRQVAAGIMEFVAKEGMELEEVTRNWHNPDRIEKGAKKLPTGIGTKNQR